MRKHRDARRESGVAAPSRSRMPVGLTVGITAVERRGWRSGQAVGGVVGG